MGSRNLPEPQDRAGLALYRRLVKVYAAKHLDSDFQPAPVGQQLNHFSTIKNAFHLCQQLKIFDLAI